MKRLYVILLAILIPLAAVVVWGALPGPVFSLSGLGAERTCLYNTTQGNTSSWTVVFNISNRGAGASAALTISVDGTGVLSEHDFVASGATVEVHRVVTDASVPVDSACTPHDVTVAIGGYVF